jgi:anion-transporting  ArsA/GET3 family ATPase
MQDLVAELQLKYDYIVVDTSPLLAAANPLTLPPIADKIVMIIEWGRTSHTNFPRLSRRSVSSDIPLAGSFSTRSITSGWRATDTVLVQTMLMAHAFELLGNTDDLRRRVALAFTTTAFDEMDIRRRCDR